MSGPIGRDLALSFAAQLAYKLLSFVILALLARGLAPDVAGAWLYALALATVAGSFTDLGASDHTSRTVAADPGRLPQALGALARTRLPLLAALLVLVPAFGLVTAPDAVPYLAVAALYAALMECWRSLAAIFAGLRQVAWTVMGFGGAQVALVAGLGIATLLAPGLPGLAAAYLGSALLALAIGTTLLVRTAGPVRLAPARGLIRRSWRLFILSTLPLVHLKLGSLLLGPLSGYAAVAAYDMGGRIIEASQFLVRPVTLVIFPACAALAAAGARGEVRRLAWPTLAVAASLGCGLAILGFLAAPLLQAVLLGPDYAHAVPLLRLLMLAVPGLLLGGAAGYVAVALGLEGRALVVAAAALALHAALATWLIPAWGAAGAAVALATALIVSALGMAAVCAQALRQTTPQAVSAR